MKNKDRFLEGWGEPLCVGQVRMDILGAIAVCIEITSENIIFKRSDRMIELIPAKDLKLLEDTSFSLGQL